MTDPYIIIILFRLFVTNFTYSMVQLQHFLGIACLNSLNLRLLAP